MSDGKGMNPADPHYLKGVSDNPNPHRYAPVGAPTPEKSQQIRALYGAAIKLSDGTPEEGFDILMGAVRAWVVQCGVNKIGPPVEGLLAFIAESLIHLEEELIAMELMDPPDETAAEYQPAVPRKSDGVLTCPVCKKLINVAVTGGLVCMECSHNLSFPQMPREPQPEPPSEKA